MKGTKYLSEVLDVRHFEKGVLNVIYAPCGCGKTTCAINTIAPLVSSPKKAIYLIDTRIGKERLSLLPELTTPYYAYPESITRRDGFFEDDDKVAVTTYAQFGYWCSCYPAFAERFEYIICDEPHNLVLFSEIGTKNKSDIPVHKYARANICAAVRNGNVVVVAISATPKPLEKLECELKDIPIDRTDLRQYDENEIIPYARIEDVLASVPLGKRGGLYTIRVEDIKAYGEILRARGFNPLLIWSDKNKDHIMSAEQLWARQYIIENEAVPDEYDVFLFNATAETSINIRSHMDFFIAHNTGDTHITQSRGRYRADLDTLYVWDRNSPYVVTVPNEFLDKVLFREDLKELRSRLNLVKDESGHEVSYDNMLRIITDCGYTCEQGTGKGATKKERRRKYYILRKEEQKSGETI